MAEPTQGGVAPRQVVLLAAGLGTRLGELSGGKPKALVEVAGRALLDRALDFAERLGAEERLVVAGYQHERVAAHLDRARRPATRLLANPDYRLGNLRTLEVALPLVRGAFLLMNIDHIYPAAVAVRILAQLRREITAQVDFDRLLGPDDMKVALDRGQPERPERRVRQIAKTLKRWDCGYVGMTYVPEACLGRYRAAVDATRAACGDPANVEQVLQQLADEGERVEIGDVSGIGWYEVDTPEDHDRAAAALA